MNEGAKKLLKDFARLCRKLDSDQQIPAYIQAVRSNNKIKNGRAKAWEVKKLLDEAMNKNLPKIQAARAVEKLGVSGFKSLLGLYSNWHSDMQKVLRSLDMRLDDKEMKLVEDQRPRGQRSQDLKDLCMEYVQPLFHFNWDSPLHDMTYQEIVSAFQTEEAVTAQLELFLGTRLSTFEKAVLKEAFKQRAEVAAVKSILMNELTNYEICANAYDIKEPPLMPLLPALLWFKDSVNSDAVIKTRWDPDDLRDFLKFRETQDEVNKAKGQELCVARQQKLRREAGHEAWERAREEAVDEDLLIQLVMREITLQEYQIGVLALPPPDADELAYQVGQAAAGVRLLPPPAAEGPGDGDKKEEMGAAMDDTDDDGDYYLDDSSCSEEDED